MAQTWHADPLLATSDTLSDSRGYINDAFDALKSCFSGSTAPASNLMQGQFFLDTDTNILQIYTGAAWTTIGDIDSTYLGLLPLSAGASYPLTGDLYCGSKNLVNVADPTSAQHGATKNYVDSNFVELSGGTMTGDLVMGANDITMDHNPDADTKLARKAYVDSIALGGGTYTNDINMDGNTVTGLAAPSAVSDAATKSYVDDYVDGSTGHAHDGTNGEGPKIPWANIDISASGPHEIWFDSGYDYVTNDAELCAVSLPAVGSGESYFVEGYVFMEANGTASVELQEAGSVIATTEYNVSTTQVDRGTPKEVFSIVLNAMVTPSGTTTYRLYFNLAAGVITCLHYSIKAIRCIDKST